ncbi:MAG: F0F1 ATP synthase subunit A [Bacteroidota bacterium]
MSVRLFAFFTTFLVGFIFLNPGAQLYGQDEHHEEHTEKVADNHSQDESNTQHGTAIAHHDEGSHDEEFNATEYILEHVSDSHDWHILTKKDGHHVSVPLPVILYSKHSGLHLFSSKKISHGHTHNGFQMGHGTIQVENKKGELVDKSLNGKIIEVDEHGEMVEAGLPLDFSITKNVFMMMLSVIILLWVFLGLARSYKKMGISEPKGLAGFIEPVIIFIEEDVAIPNIGEEKYTRFMPYLLTVFFFILLNNLMGLIPFFPFGANVTGNIAVTMVLAVITFLITQFSSNKGHWQHVFNTPGVPVWLAPIMIPVELIGLITKPFALMIRLFANITAGHIIVLSLISMIFIFKSVFVALPSMLMVLFMDFIELLVAFLQAYIFTLLSALFIGMAMPEHHHD